MVGTSKMKGTQWMTLFTLALVAFLPWVESGTFKGISGDFCRHRKPSECCTDREDTCEVPIQGTYCYCDAHCQTGEDVENDCCPDFAEVCLGQKDIPYTGCKKDGLFIPDNDTVKFNCNECQCVNSVLKCEEDACMINGEVVAMINKAPKDYGWRASNYPEFWGRKAWEGLLLRTGTLSPEDMTHEIYPIILRPDVSTIPESFDARKVQGAGLVGEIYDQGWCGASWAFSTLGVAQDRLSVFGQLSAQNLMSCAKLGQEGCEGGHVERAWNYLRSTGIVREECYRYESGQSGKIPACLIRRTDLSSLTCESKDRFRMEPAYRISGKVEDIQWEILHNGPVQALMTVHSDLFMYKSSVYSYSGFEPINGQQNSALHSVRIVGWGSAPMMGSDPVKFWLVANSWGTGWGEEGYFRIKRGINECGIESFILAARPKRRNVNGIKY